MFVFGSLESLPNALATHFRQSFTDEFNVVDRSLVATTFCIAPTETDPRKNGSKP